MQIHSSFHSQIRVRPVTEEEEGLPTSDAMFDLRVHTQGWADLKFVQELERLNLREIVRSREILSEPFSRFPLPSSQTAEDICSKQSPESGAWNGHQLEMCVQYLASCDLAKCKYDLVRIMVSYALFFLSRHRMFYVEEDVPCFTLTK